MTNSPASFVLENWAGGFYELYIECRTASSGEIRALLAAIWSWPPLDGCYLERDLAPSMQSRLTPDEFTGWGHLYGVASIPDAGPVVCGTYTSGNPEERDADDESYLGFYFPLAALSHYYDVGSYPFGPIGGVPEWRTPVDDFLRHLADWTFERVPFDLGIIGFEIGASLTARSIRLGGIPEKRSDGILWNTSGSLEWHGPNLP